MIARGQIPVSRFEREAMAVALTEAELAAAADEIPVGAVVLSPDGVILARAHNDREVSLDPTGHAEILAIRAAARRLQSRFLDRCTLVITLEPCVMCAGAIAAARLPRVIFGAWDEKAGAAGSVYDVLRDSRLPQPPAEVLGGVSADESAELLARFFRARRD